MKRNALILTGLSIATLAYAGPSAEELAARADSYAAAARAERLRQIEADYRKGEAEFQRRGGREAVTADFVRDFGIRMPVSLEGAYWQFPKDKKGRYASGRKVLITRSGVYCLWQSYEMGTRSIQCFHPNGAPYVELETPRRTFR